MGVGKFVVERHLSCTFWIPKGRQRREDWNQGTRTWDPGGKEKSLNLKDPQTRLGNLSN